MVNLPLKRREAKDRLRELCTEFVEVPLSLFTILSSLPFCLSAFHVEPTPRIGGLIQYCLQAVVDSRGRQRRKTQLPISAPCSDAGFGVQSQHVHGSHPVTRKRVADAVTVVLIHD